MSDYWESWWLGGDAYGRKTRAELDDVRASESRARSRLANQMHEQQGNLQGQLDRLTQAFVALIEYEDIRGELNEHADAAACRRYAREVVPNLVVTGGSGLGAVPPPPEVHDYWLSWAIRGVVDTATGGDGTGQLVQATACDPQRTALLLVLIDVIRRETRFGEGRLDLTLPDAVEISHADRGIWLALADGHLGDAAEAALEGRLRGLLGTPAPVAVETWVRALASGRGLSDAARAAATLAALERLVDPTTPAPPAEPAEPEVPSSSEDPLAEVLRSLVDEGAPGETQILDRMSEVRGRMGFVEDRDTASRWDAPSGDLLDLLLLDLADTRADSGRRSLAVRLLGPSLPPLIEVLRHEAVTLPADRQLHVSGIAVVIGSDGVTDPGWRRRVQDKVGQESTVPPALRPVGYLAVAIGVIGLVLMVVDPGWVLLALLGLGAGVALLLQDRRLRKEVAASTERRLKRSDAEVAEATAQHAVEHQSSRAAAAGADESAARLGGLLGMPHPA